MDQVKSNFFENQILEAIETVTNSIVSKLKFDQTILCTITDDSNKQNGIYEVTDKTSTFTATSSDTSYSKDMVVYVLIPQGKYENQKTIIGKYVDDTATAINHVASTENIIEIKKFSSLDASCEGWEEDSTKWSLLANKKNNQNDKITLSELFNISWDENTNIYTCVGLKAKFKTRLHDYLIKKGSYGLVLTLQGYKANDEGELKIFQDEYIFNNSEMYGDPYNYNDYVEHDIVFDLTDKFKDIKITGVRLDFYEKNDFLDINNELIPYSYLIDGKEALYPDNLFVKDIDLIFGYTQDDILKEGIQIYTPDDFKYATREDSKNILLKWFVQNEIGSSQTAYGIIDELEEVPKENGEAIDTFSIYWYRYKIGNQEPDPILGKGYWEIIPGAVYRDKKFVHEMQNKKVWDVKTKTEVFVYKKDEYGNDTTEIEQEEAPELKYNLIEDNSGRYYKTADNKLAIATDDILKDSSIQKYQVEMVLEPVYNFSEDDDLDEPFRYIFGPNELLSEEKIKAVLKCRKYEEVLTPDEKDETIQYVSFKESYDIYESNELLFENKNPAVKKLSEINLIREMRLSCDDGSNGVYMIYNDVTNEIGDSTKTNNRLSVYFDNYSTIDIPKDQEDCKITWKIPASNSMIKPVNFRMENGFKDIRKTNTETGEISGFDKNLVSEDTVAYIPNSSGIDTIAEEEDPHLIEWSKEPIDGYYQCSYYWTSAEDETSDSIFENQSLYMHYGLNPAYVSSAKNNTIICEIEKYGRVYKAEMSMVFGSAGANGTKYTLYINLEKEYGTDSIPTDKKTGLLDNKKPTSNEDVSFLEWKGINNNPWIKVVAKLYDEHFTDITAGKKFSWSWHTGKVYGLEMYSDGEANNSNECYIRLTYNIDKNNDKTLDDFALIDYYGILKVATGAEWLGDNTSLVNYLPIPIRGESSGITEYIGAKKLIYDAQGKAPKDDSFQAAHRLEINGSEVEVSTWELKLIKEDSVLLKSYSPTFDYERTYEWTETTNDETGEVEKELVRIDGEHSNILKPTDLYFAELNEVPMSIIAYDLEDQVIFNQPLLYHQNQYGVSMLNNWDGAQIVDAAGNKILTALVGAGIKNSNNTFSGVFMGEVEAVGSEKKTGLLGFNQGIHTFGFHTDGTAFIGPSGGGRITFDGNEGIIESAKKNTIFNLKEGSIYLSNSATKKSDGTNLNPSVEIILDSNGRNSGPFFQIQDSSTSNNLIKISKDDYYLQSVAGHTKFDLMKGSIHLSNEDYLDPAGKTPAGKIVIDSDGSPAYFQISHYKSPVYEEDGETIKEAAQESELIHIGPRGYYLQSFNYANGSYADEKMSDGSTLSVYTPGTGMKIDLKSGTIQGYDFTLVAGQKADANDYRLIITSDQNKKPLTIGSNFYVDWDGSLHANNGKFMGMIEANTGSIGGWNIDKDVLYYGWTSIPATGTSWTSGTNKAIIAPKGVSITGLNTVSSSYTYVDLDLDEDGNIQYDAEGNIIFKNINVNRSNSIANNIVFNVGKNFAIDTDGVLYVKESVIGGYATDTDLSSVSSELKSTLNTVNLKLSGDIATNASNIGQVDLKTQGAISSLGTLGNNTIFLSQTYNNSAWKVVEGIYYNDQFYPALITYSESLTPIKDAYYKDLSSGDYYQYNGTNYNKITDGSTPSAIPGYYNTTDSQMYAKRNMVQQDPKNATGNYLTSFESNTVYLSIAYDDKPPQAYIKDSITSTLKLAENEKITIFSVSSEGLLYGANAVISGTIYATNGWFSGKVSAREGEIGNWIINTNSDLQGEAKLNKGTANESLLSTTILHAVSKNNALDADDYFSKLYYSYTLTRSEESENPSKYFGIITNKSVELYETDEGEHLYKHYFELTGKTKYKYDNYISTTYAQGQMITNYYIQLTSRPPANWKEYQVNIEYGSEWDSSLSSDVWTYKIFGSYVSSTESGTVFSYRGDEYYSKKFQIILDETCRAEDNYKFFYEKADSYTLSWSDYNSQKYKEILTIINTYKSDLFKDEEVLKYLLAPSVSIQGNLSKPIDIIGNINGTNQILKTYAGINLGGDFEILRNGNIQITPGTMQIMHGNNYYDNNIIHIDFKKNLSDDLMKLIGEAFILPSLLSASLPNNDDWKILTGVFKDNSYRSSALGFSYENSITGVSNSFTIDNNGSIFGTGTLGDFETYWDALYLDKLFTPSTYFDSISDYRGGFHLNSNKSSEYFWKNSLYTYNTKVDEDKYTHYVGFIRSVGDTSQNLSNVFLGSKQIINTTPNFPKSSNWETEANISSYNFYIRFDGKAKFETFHTKKYNSGNYGLRPNQTLTERGTVKYLLGSDTYPWTKLYVEEIVLDGTTFNPSTSITTTSLTITDSTSTASLEDNGISLLSDSTDTTISHQMLSLYGGATTLSNTGFSLNNGTVTINSSGVLSCSKIKSTEIDFSSTSWSSLVLNNSGDLKLTFKYVSSSDRIIAYSPGLNTSSTSGKPCKGRDKALIKMDAVDGTLLYYRPLFSLQGSTAGKTWDFGINPRHAELEDASYQYSDELFLYGFSSSAYKNNGDPSFSLGIGRRWSTNSDADDAAVGYNYIIPRTDIKLGTSGFKWKEIWCVNELNTSSDIRLKIIQNSQYLDKLLIMYNNIIPIAYKRKNISKEDSHDRIHIGFSAQNVEEELLKVSLTSMDFGGICIDNTSDPFFKDGKMYGLRYGEFHGLHVLKNQEQDRRILELEQKVQYLENKILELSGKGV